MSDDREDSVLELLARDLDGDLDREERSVLHAHLAERPDSDELLRAAADFKRATDTLSAACAATPTPDMTGFILDALQRDVEAQQRPVGRASGWFGALKSAFSRGKQRDTGTASGGWRLGSDDLMGVVAGTGAPTDENETGAPSPDESTDAAPDQDAERDKP